MTDRVDPAVIIAAEHGAYATPGRTYPRPLPPDLAPWYLYLVDGGHSIAVLLSGYEDQGTCPAPVKAVLAAGWSTTPDGHILCSLPFDPQLGLRTDPAFTEFDADTPLEPRQYIREVGQLYRPDVTRWTDGASQLRLSDRSAELVLFLASPDQIEIDAIRRGDARFALLAGEHALLLAVRLKPLPWIDAPWQASRQTDATTGLPPTGTDGHLRVPIVLVDAATGITTVIRNTTWTPTFTAAVRAAIQTQHRNHSTPAQGDAEIDSWYHRYPDSSDIARAATITTRA